jgi:RimJ/RimL family protein N-acetyltransferase
MSFRHPTIKTERLVLRALRPDDADRMTDLANDFDVARMTSSMPHPFGREHAESFIERVQGLDPATDRVFAIDKPGEGLIGVVGFHDNDDFPAREMGYWLGRPFWGAGYATEVAKAALVWASESWGLRTVFASHFADNPASGGVLAKAGFLYTGWKALRSVARGGIAPGRTMVWLA